ncbi:uroporphyrinogen-III synthase [Shewanella surugensis]|uniref:Uroporphyrinogen-III synthase n=1 Tax=Shewanella surugensis TaxID=212020 RepID=A0ABT0LHR2_9GAMM|nr:uroporphyrinogen-III synthase [Shewanella surugensis]MCL1126666.1 uroporphyrinogen-III synthase [Shewanella surugensis]
MKVLLTRPQGRNQLMAAALRRYRIPYMITPLIDIIAATQTSANHSLQLTQADDIIFVSTNAVKFADSLVKQPWPEHLRYFAIGKATQDALLAIDIKALTPHNKERQTTEGLLDLPELKSLKNKKVLIVRGVGGREALADELKQRQAEVTYWEVYQRAPINLDAKQITNQWKIEKIDTIIVTSGEILDNLIKLVPKELFYWLKTCHIIVPSARVESVALSYGLKFVTNAKAANQNAMIAALIT